MRDDADRLLCQAATDGADLEDLGRLAEAIYQRTRGPDDDDEDGFGDRNFHLGITFSGAGPGPGDLTPGCAAALAAVLDALGKKAGPEDTRTAAQRRHDALEDACRRLIATGMLPARGGQPTQVHVHLGLAELRDLPGAAATEHAWMRERTRAGAAGRAGLAARAPGRPGWLTGAEAQAAACDATIVPVVTGQHRPDRARPAHRTRSSRTRLSDPGVCRAACTCRPRRRGARPRRCARALLGLAIDALSGPGGLAAALRTGLAGTELSLATPLTSISLPLDIGAGSEAIPAHLRRAVTLRHPHCAFPGCHQPASVCDVHHLIPRSAGGATALSNLVPLCRFHHLIAIHHWGWTLRLNPDGTTTATSPDGHRIYTATAHPPRPPRPGLPLGNAECRCPGVPSHSARECVPATAAGRRGGSEHARNCGTQPAAGPASPAELAWATLSSPVGPLAVGCTAAGLAQVRLPDLASGPAAGRAGRAAGQRRPAAARPRPGTRCWPRPGTSWPSTSPGSARSLTCRSTGPARPPAQRQVLDVLYRTVGYGDTVTYGELAQRAVAGPDGVSLPARAIGGIMGSNPIPVVVPCHRVVAGNGLGGYSGGTGIEVKRWLLIFEGALPATLDWTAAGLA